MSDPQGRRHSGPGPGGRLMSQPVPIALVVEDEREIRRFVRSSLEAEGWQVCEADSV